MSNQINSLTSLPHETQLDILAYMDQKELATCARVCRLWAALANRDILWKQLYPKMLIPNGISAKQYIINNTAKSVDIILERIKKFIDNTMLNTTNHFVCYFFSPENYIDVEFGYYTEVPQSELGRDNFVDTDYFKKTPQKTETHICVESLPEKFSVTSHMRSGLHANHISYYATSLNLSDSAREHELKDAICKYMEEKIEQLKTQV